ncbi:MAG: type II toxin-antitoxin system VapC family toxin [Planctomycetia bacterium]|nr:type II toxin-antitoxin system VapC family toxin [Planctomycetia bacterium]
MNFPTVTLPNSPPSFVLDVSVAASWGIPMRYTVYTHRVQSRLASGTVTIIATNWPLDLVDELLVAVNRGETTPQRADALLANLSAYRIYLDPQGPFQAWPDVLNLARTHNLSVHQAASLELALRLNLSLATTDATLTLVANASGISIFTP